MQRTSILSIFSLLFLSFFAKAQTPDANGIVYVKSTITGDGTGSSWTNAYSGLANVLKAAKTNTGIKQIWVAKGVYKPLFRADNLSGADAGDRDNAFLLVRNVKIYGGFDPENNMVDLSTRNSKLAVTILSGDVDGNGNISNNAYHVVIAAGDAGTAELDGFTVTGGNAEGFTSRVVNTYTLPQIQGAGMYIAEGSPKIANVIVTGNSAFLGGGIYSTHSSSAINNVMIMNNVAQIYDGGGMYNANSSQTLTNVVICRNSADRGGGINNSVSNPTLVNVVISNNTAYSRGAGIHNISGSSAVIRNSIIYGNIGTTQIYNDQTYDAPIISYSLVQGSGGSASWNIATGNNGGNNLDVNPLFTNATNNDYTLLSASPAINVGNNTFFPGLDANTKDLAGNPRLNGATIDLGAYEYQGVIALPVTLNDFAVVVMGQTAQLRWQSISEVNNSHFDVLRSADGKSFTLIGSVVGHGTTNAVQDYRFVDYTPLTGDNYYRLSPVDIDGKVSFSKICYAKFDGAMDLIKAYPSPFRNELNITLSIVPSTDTKLLLYNISGVLVMERFIPAGTKQLKLPTANLPVAMYILHYGSSTLKVLKMRQ